MFNPIDLFKQRVTDHIKHLNRYLRYIFNGHFMIALIFMVITLAVYYQRWLENIHENFPAALVIALVLGFIVSYNPLQMFLKEPDKVFLIVKEEQMKQYFRLTLVYNYVVQLYVVFFAAAAVIPLYSTVYPGKDTLDYFLLFVIILVVKAWNLLSNWYMLKIRNTNIRLMDKALRTILSILFVYFLLIGKFVVIFAVFFFIVIANSIILARKQSGLAWDVLIENDQNRLALFYRFVSMFADAPQMTKRLKKRRILASIVNKNIPFKHNATFDYLFRLTFIRSGDYLSMYIRLIIIGGLVIFFVPNIWLKVIFAILFIYMSSFQMISLYYHHRTSIWLDLYPVKRTIRERAFLKWLTQLTVIQTIIFSLIFLIWVDIASFVLTLSAGILFSYLFNYNYVKRKIQRS